MEHHGKGPYDATRIIPQRAVSAVVMRGHALPPGTRELVLHLATHHGQPRVANSKKDGWIAADRYIYCFYHPSKFTQLSVLTAMGFPDSHSHNHFVGVCLDKGKAENDDGPLHARKCPATSVPC